MCFAEAARQQATEADFRFALAKVRDAAEQVALYRGNAVEQQRLMRRDGFASIAEAVGSE